MTSCLLLKAPDRLVAVADGRLATSETKVSFDSAEKIRTVTPKYQIPRFAMGRFNNYSEMVERDWYLAYAGTYALVSQIGDLFIRNVGGGLYLSRGEGGVPHLGYDIDTSGWFDDNYNFDSGELPRMTSRVIVDELLAAAQTKCDEWTGNGRDPDCEFLLFGEDAETRRYVAFKVAPDLTRWRRGERAPFQAIRIDDGVVAVIGSPAVAAAVARDEALWTGATTWRKDQTYAGIDRLLVDLALFGDEPPQRREHTPEPLPEEDWGVDAVKLRFVRAMVSAADKYVGGDLTAILGYGFELWRRTIQIVD